MTLTRQHLIDDLALRVQAAKPSEDFQPTNQLLGTWIDDARDAFIAAKVASLAPTRMTLGANYQETELLPFSSQTLKIGNSPTGATAVRAALAKRPLSISTPKSAEAAFTSVRYFTNNTKERTIDLALTRCMSEFIPGSVSLFGGDDGGVLVSFDKGATFEDISIPSVTDTVTSVVNFGDEFIAQILEVQGGTAQHWYHTKDNGLNWTLATTPATGNVAVPMRQAKDGSKVAAWVETSGLNGSGINIIYGGTPGKVFTTSAVDFETEPVNPAALSVVSAGIMMVAGNAGHISRTTQGPKGDGVWKDISVSSITDNIVSMDWANQYEGIAFFEFNDPVFTQDGGENWTSISIPIDFALKDTGSVYSLGDGTFIFSDDADGSIVLITDDYGNTWDVAGSVKGETINVASTPTSIDIFQHNAGSGRLLKIEEVSQSPVQEVLMTSPKFVSSVNKLRFAKPARNNIVGFYENIAGIPYVTVEGVDSIDAPSGLEVRYIAESREYRDSDVYPIDGADKDAILEIAFETALGTVAYPELEDNINDGN